MAEKRLGCHDDQGLSEWKGNLSSENMEIVSRGGAVGHNHVDVDQLLDSELFILWREIFRIITKQNKV